MTVPMTKARPAEARRRAAWAPAADAESLAAADYNGTAIFKRPNLEHFVTFCAKLRLDNGRPFVIEDWQRDILADYFDGVLETLVLLPTGNGKTTLYAAVVLHHLLYTEAPEAFIIASSRDQAGRLHAHIAAFVERSKQLQRLVRVLRRSIERIHSRGSVEVLSADAGTADGIGGTLVIGDEMHRWPNGDLYVVALKGLKKRGGQFLHCSTAGETMESILGEVRKRCLELPNLTRVGMYSHARAEDNTLAFHEFALDVTDDPHDMAVVKQANPLSTITIEQLSALHAAFKWWDWARFICGLWVAGQHAAVSAIDWAACQYETVEFDPAHEQLLVADLAWVGDCTAINAVQAVSRLDVRLKKVAIITPAGDGTALLEEQIVGPVREYKRKNPNCRHIVIDPEAGGRSLIEKFEDLGLEVIEHSQKNEPMTDAYKQFEGVIRRRIDDEDPDSRRVLQVQSDPELTRHVLAAEAKHYPGLGDKLVKRRKNPEPIDGGVSAAMGVRSALAELDAEPIDRSLYRLEFA
jgi:phage terminase large subunit-like protein